MELLTVGKIGGTHHLKGAVKLYSNIGDQIYNIEGSKVILEFDSGESQILTVKTVAPLVAEKWIIDFEEITNKTEAGKLIKGFVKARRDLLGVEDDEYLLNDLLDMTVIDSKGVEIGKITSIFDTAAHEILEVESDKYEAMIPNIDEFVKEIDFEKKVMHVSLIEGMLETKKVKE